MSRSAFRQHRFPASPDRSGRPNEEGCAIGTRHSPASGALATAPRRHGALQRWTFWLTAAYLVALVLIAFWPTPVDRSAHHDLLGILRWLQLHGAPPWVRYDVVEFSANIALFAPVGVFVVILAGPRRWWLALLAGFAASCAIELGQLLFLPNRYATLADVVANTAGAAVGTSLGLLLLALAPSLNGRTGRASSPCPVAE